MDILTDKRFLIGLAVGWLVIPRVVSAVTMRMSVGAGTQSAA